MNDDKPQITLNKRNIRQYLGMLAHVYSLQGTREVDLMVYGGGALLLASNFREKTEDLDCFINNDAPVPLSQNREMELAAIGLERTAKELVGDTTISKGWVDAGIYMAFEGSNVNLATKQGHIYLETISADYPAFRVHVPSKGLMLTMKAKAMRIDDKNGKKAKDLDDLLNLLTLHPEIKNDQQLMAFSATYFPTIRENIDVVAGARDLFGLHRDRPRHGQPYYSAGSRLES